MEKLNTKENPNSNQEIPKNINLFEFICKINSDAKQPDNNDWMLNDSCNYMSYILEFYGIKLDDDFHEYDYPEWYIALEALVINIAITTNIFNK